MNTFAANTIFSFFFFFIYLFIMYTAFLPCMSEGQKRAPDPITDGCEPGIELSTFVRAVSALKNTLQFSCLLFLLLFIYFIYLFIFFWFFETEFLCGFGACPGASFVDQAGLELTEIRLPLPPKCWD